MAEQLHPNTSTGLAERYADRVRAAMPTISDERAQAFRTAFAGLGLEEIKQALAVSDDPEIVGAIAASLDKEPNDG